MKPDDISQDVWDKTGTMFDSIYAEEPNLEGGCEQTIREYAARAIQSAKAEAYEEAAGQLSARAAEFRKSGDATGTALAAFFTQAAAAIRALSK